MTTTFDDAPDRVSGADETPTGEALPRLRRFAPRRSRSAGAPAGVTPADPPIEPAQLHEHGQTVEVDPASTSRHIAAQTAAPVGEPAPEPQAAPVAPARNRRSRPRRAVATTADPRTSEPQTEAVAEAVAPISDDRHLGDHETTPPSRMAETGAPTTQDLPPTIEAPEPHAPAEETAPAARAARSRTRRRPAAAKAQTVEVPPIEQAEATPVADTPVAPAAIAERPAETPARAARSRRPRHRQAGAAPPTEEQPIAVAGLDTPEQGAADLVASAPVEAEEPSGAVEPLAAWFPAGEMTQNSPKGELDGTEALARALLEMFPPAALEEGPTATDDAEPTELAADDVLAEAQAILEDQDGEEEAEDGSPRKRSRRGRRGGRGRRRGGLAAMPSDEMQAPDYAEPDGDSSLAAMANGDLGATAAESSSATIADSAPATSSDAAPFFVPENPPRPDRPWRERGPRRIWSRTYGRETSPPVAAPPVAVPSPSMPHVSMPPPKPSNGARFAPIPQAAPPLSAVAQPEIVLSAPSMFVMPDLRLNEPLAPGETRTERLLEAQTRLLQAMLEQQARQIDMLTGSVNSLRQTVQNLGTGGELHTYQPRTGIFVDAPNVVYAADNARVNLDYARMLKYLSRDRHLVHAFAYSPIIDDVREGIRYETQRFVAPFLRAGYKLVTKPLKRFSDGSAKGNFDIELAVDIVTMSERLDLVVLVSGDSDFERLIQLIQSRGVRVEVVAFASNVSTELVNIADVFIDINQHIEHLRVL